VLSLLTTGVVDTDHKFVAPDIVDTGCQFTSDVTAINYDS